jgi:hypothetical protein
VVVSITGHIMKILKKIERNPLESRDITLLTSPTFHSVLFEYRIVVSPSLPEDEGIKLSTPATLETPLFRICLFALSKPKGGTGVGDSSFMLGLLDAKILLCAPKG